MNITVFCGSSQPHNAQIAVAARELGRQIAIGGHTLLYGGSNLGLMGAVSSGALQAGGTVIAVTPTFFSEEIINSQPVSEIVRVGSMAERKEYLIAHSDAFVALPGGIGTLDEVMEVMVYNQLGPLRDPAHRDKPIALYNPDGFWQHFERLIEVMGHNGFYRSGQPPKYFTAPDIDALLQNIIGLCGK